MNPALVCIPTYNERENVESIVRSMISEAVALQLDATLFSTTAEDVVNPGGILNGVAPLALPFLPARALPVLRECLLASLPLPSPPSSSGL